MNVKKHKFWSWVKAIAEKKMEEAYFHGGNCGAICSRCKQPEWLAGSFDLITDNAGYDTLTCSNCSHVWRVEFGPAGWMPLPAEMQK